LRLGFTPDNHHAGYFGGDMSFFLITAAFTRALFAAPLALAALTTTPGIAKTPAPAKAPPPAVKPVAPIPETVTDGRVAGLNSATFAALKSVKTRNPGALTEANAMELRTAIMADGKIDIAERDLLREMTQSQFRSINVTVDGAKWSTLMDLALVPATSKVATYPVSGNAKRVLQDVLDPPVDLAREWAGGSAGWNAIVRAYAKSPVEESRVINFVAGKFAEQWELSNMANGYKPLRDEIGKRYGFSNSAGGDAKAGSTVIYKAMNQVDRNAKDAVPDFLYNWVRPGGYM
jgi:hypothetical protein